MSDEVVRPEVLDDLVSDFIKWSNDNYYYEYTKDLRTFIENMAIWYELRVPTEDDLFKMGKNLCEIDYAEGSKLRSKLEETVVKNTDKLYYDLKLFNNSELFPIKRFIESNNTKYLDKPRYDKSNYKIKIGQCYYSFTLTKKGRVRNYGQTKFEIYDLHNNKYEFVDVTVNELLECLKCVDLDTSLNDFDMKFYSLIDEYERDCEFKDRLLDSVMYRIIERGGKSCGATRGYLFAKEFNRSTSIPLKYGLYYLDVPVQKAIVKDYINNDGNKDIECFSEYFDRIYKYEGLSNWQLSELMDDFKILTKEQIAEENIKNGLYERLVNAIASSINEDKLMEAKNEEITRKRIERKLNKTNTNK